LVVLAALIFLLRAISADSPADPVSTTAPPPATTTPAPASPTPSAAPTPSRPAPAAAQTSKARTSQLPSLPSFGNRDSSGTTGSSDAPPGSMQNTKGLQYGLPHMRERIAANTAQLTACMGSKRPTAEVSMQFIVALHGGKYVVEQVDVDGDKTTLQDDAVLDCMMNATKKIQLDGLPREASAILITRVTTLADGAVTDDKPLKFSYLK
jgi:hypothetical protein